MEIRVLPNSEKIEVGFIHKNGALVLFPVDNESGAIVVNGLWGNYEDYDDNYFIWRAEAERILYKGDVLEFTL